MPLGPFDDFQPSEKSEDRTRPRARVTFSRTLSRSCRRVMLDGSISPRNMAVSFATMTLAFTFSNASCLDEVDVRDDGAVDTVPQA